MLTRPKTQRADYFVQAAKLVVFAVDPEVITSKQKTDAVVLNAQVIDKEVGMPAMGEWTKVGEERDTLQELELRLTNMLWRR